MSDPDAERVRRVTEAMFKMTKIEIAKLRQAYEGQV
jgi:predicted 3-demethylubiquinone-9 3-methyltransferase (glyoxalase superfamily)